jgi:hypothetical protein
MLKLFIQINTRLWWREVKGVEIGAILFYSLFLLLVLGQFIAVAITLLFAPEVDAVREAFPWFTEEVQLMIHLLFVNTLWFTQLFFTKIGRLRLPDNRKLLALGMPNRKLVHYLNLAGFLHPVNLIFHVIWLIYLGMMTTTAVQLVTVAMFVIANYGLINAIKWRFKLFSEDKLKWVNGVLALAIITLVFFGTIIDLSGYVKDPAPIAETLNSWLAYSPGSFIYWLAGADLASISAGLFAAAFIALIGLLSGDLYRQTRKALLTPVSYSSGVDQSTNVGVFIKWLGHQGGKYFYSVWSHPYSKTQFILTYILIIPYIFFLNDGSASGSFMAAVFLTLIPVLFLMVMLTNLFGFENRELLLTLQAPIDHHKIITDRFISAFKVTVLAMVTVWIAIPFLFESVATMFQVLFGVFFITVIFLHYVLQSCINNYKKVEYVSLISVSNPIIPASITFTSMLMVVVLGIVTFIVFEQIQWIHILALIVATLVLGFTFYKKLNRISGPFKSKVIPQLWNEL